MMLGINLINFFKNILLCGYLVMYVAYFVILWLLKFFIFFLFFCIKIFINFIYLVIFLGKLFFKISILCCIQLVIQINDIYLSIKLKYQKSEFLKYCQFLFNKFLLKLTIYFKYQNNFIYYNSIKLFNTLIALGWLTHLNVFFLCVMKLFLKIFQYSTKIINICILKIKNMLQYLYIFIIAIKNTVQIGVIFFKKINKFIIMVINKIYKLFIQTLHLKFHKSSNFYRTILFFFQYKYFSLIVRFIYKKLISKKKFNLTLINSTIVYNSLGIIDKKYSYMPIKFSFFWYCFIIWSTLFSCFIMVGWVSLFYLLLTILSLLYMIWLFLITLIKYLFFNWKNKYLLIHLLVLADIIYAFTKIQHYLNNTLNWEKIYIFTKKNHNHFFYKRLNKLNYKISLLFLTINVNNSIKLNQLKKKQLNLYTKYTDNVTTSIFFRSMDSVKDKSIEDYKNHQICWQELGIVGDNLYTTEHSWALPLIQKLTKYDNFKFFTKIINYFSHKNNITWDKFKINTIIDTYEDFSFYNEANIRIDHLYGDMSAATEEMGALKSKRVLQNSRKFMNIFRRNFERSSLFYFKDQNLIGLHKQNKISHLTWKTIYFLLRKHREFQWSKKQLKRVYEIEPFESNKKAGLWNKKTFDFKIDYQRISWPVFYSKVVPSIFYTFSFLHDFYFTFFVEYINDFYQHQINLLKTTYHIKQSLANTKINNSIYGISVTFLIKFLWFILYDFWRILWFLSLKVFLSLSFFYKNENKLKIILDYTLHLLVYIIQHLKINDYTLISYMYSYKWNNFFTFKLATYKYNNLRDKKTINYFKYGYFSLFLDMAVFLLIYIFIYCYDLLKLISIFFFYKILSVKQQNQCKMLFFIGYFLYLNFILFNINKLYGWKIYFDLWFHLIYTTKYSFKDIDVKRYHLKRYNIQTDLQGNWLEKDYLTLLFLRISIASKLINKYWWSVKIPNKKGLESWPFFYNWFKKIPEIGLIYKFNLILVFLIWYYFKQSCYFIFDYYIKPLFFLIKSVKYLSFTFILKFIRYFVIIYILEWFFYGLLVNITSIVYLKKTKIKGLGNFIKPYYNLSYNINFFFNVYYNFFKTKQTTTKFKGISKRITAVKSFEHLYQEYDKFNCKNVINEMKYNQYTCKKELTLKNLKIKTEVFSFFYYISIYLKEGKIQTNQRKKKLLEDGNSVNLFKNQMLFWNIDKIWFTMFCQISLKILKIVLQCNKYNNSQLLNPTINLFFTGYRKKIKKFYVLKNKSFFNKLFNKWKKDKQFEKVKENSLKSTISITRWNLFNTNQKSYIIVNFNKLDKINNIFLQFFFYCNFFFKQLIYIEYLFIILLKNELQYQKIKIISRKNRKLKKLTPKKKKNYTLWLKYIFIWKKYNKKALFYFLRVYFLMPQDVKNIKSLNNKKINKLFKLYSKFFKNQVFKDIKVFIKNKKFKNIIFFKHIFLKDMIEIPTKTTSLEEFLGLKSKTQLTINKLINAELELLEREGYYNINSIKKEWHILSLNYFIHLRDTIKNMFLDNFSTSRVRLNFKIIRLLFRNWRLRKKTRKFTSYFWKLFRMSSQAFNLTRRNAFAKWHVLDGSNYSGENHKSFYKYNIIREGEKKKISFITIWYNIVEYFTNQRWKEKKYKNWIKKKLQNIYITEKIELRWFEKIPFFNGQKDIFFSPENQFGKRLFLGFLFDDFLKTRPKLYKLKVKFFFWWNLSWGPYLIIPAFWCFLISFFGVSFFFELDVFSNVILWCYQLLHSFITQWVLLYCSLPFTLLSNIFVIDWSVICNSLFSPFVLHCYFYNGDFYFFKIESIRVVMDILFLNLNNPYIIEDYSLYKSFLQVCFISMYGILLIIWKLYLTLTWLTYFYLDNCIGSLFIYNTFYIFIWDRLLYFTENFFLYSSYSIYIGMKYNFNIVFFLYFTFIKLIWFIYTNLIQSLILFKLNSYNMYILFSDVIILNVGINLSFYDIYTFINVLLNKVDSLLNFIFYFNLYYFLYYKAYLVYYILMVKLNLMNLITDYLNFTYLYLSYIFQDFIMMEFFHYIISIWMWVYFNIIYYLIIYPVKISCYLVYIILKKLWISFIILPKYIFTVLLIIWNFLIVIISFLYTQFILIYKLVFFIAVKPFILIYSYLLIPVTIYFKNYLMISALYIWLQWMCSWLITALMFPYYILYKFFCYLGGDFFIFSLSMMLTGFYELCQELGLFYGTWFWNYISGIWGILFFFNDIILTIFPGFDKILYPFGGFSILYAAFFYYIFILFAVLWSRSFRIFNDTTIEVGVPEYVWEKTRFEIEGSKIYSLMSLNLYKMLWIEKLSTNKKSNIPQELLDSLDTWTIRERRSSYQLLVRLHDTPLNYQGFYYKYFTDLTRPFVVKYYRLKLSFSTRLNTILPWHLYKMLIKRLKYSMWLWYVEGYLAYVTEEDPDAIYSVGPSAGEVAGREANFDGQFDVLLKDYEIIQKVKRLKLYNFYFMKKEKNSVGIAQDVWYTFPIIGHVFGQHHLKKIKSMKNRETFIFEFTPNIDQTSTLTPGELKVQKYYLEDWINTNKRTIWQFSENKITRNVIYSEPGGKLLDLKADPRYYKLNRYVKVDEDDGINPDFYNDFMYLGSRSLDLLLTPFLSFAAVNTAWWNQENGILAASYRFLELSNMADQLINNYIKDEFGADQLYKIMRQNFLSTFATGEERLEFLTVNEEDFNLLKYGQPLVSNYLDEVKSQMATEIFTKFPEIKNIILEEQEDKILPKTPKDLIYNSYTTDIMDDILTELIDKQILTSLNYERWSSSLKDLYFKEYFLGLDDVKAMELQTKTYMFKDIFYTPWKIPNINDFTDKLRNVVLDEMLFFSNKTQWESAFTDKIVSKSFGLKTKDQNFGKTFNFQAPPLFNKEIEIGAEVEDKEKWRRLKGFSKEKLLEATTAHYNIYTDSIVSDKTRKNFLYNQPKSLYYLTNQPKLSSQEEENIVFINFFSNNKTNLILTKKELKEIADFNLIDNDEFLRSSFQMRYEQNIRSSPLEVYKKPTRFEIEERDKALLHLENKINQIINAIETRYYNHENPSMVNLFEECSEEILIGKLLFKSTSPAPAFGYFVKYYILQRLISLYISAYEGTFFGNFLYYLTRSFIVRSPVTGIDVLPIVALDINNNSDIYYLSGFYGLPRVNALYKESLMPYTQFTYTKHYLVKSLQQQALLYFTDKFTFLKQFHPDQLVIDWNTFPYLHPELDTDKKVRMIYQHIYSASFNHPNIYNEGLYLIKLREFYYFLGVEVWLSEVKDMFTIDNKIIKTGLNILKNLVSWDFWIFFFRSDWIVFVENHSHWFSFTFHVFGYLEHEIDLYPVVWYSMHVVEYTKTLLWLIFDVTKFFYFPNLTLYYLRFDFWYNLIKPFFINFKLSLNQALAWSYDNIWPYRWFLDVSSFFINHLFFSNQLFINIINAGNLHATWAVKISHIIHVLAYWKAPLILFPYIATPALFLKLSNILQFDLYSFFSTYFVDKTFIQTIPTNKHLLYAFFSTNTNSFLYYNLWYDYYCMSNSINEKKKDLFLSELFNQHLNIRYDEKLLPTLLQENLISPYSFKVNYGNYFLTAEEVHLLYNTDYYKQDAIGVYHTFDFLFTNPLNKVFYKNFIETGDSKNPNISFLLNFHALYQDLMTMHISTNILDMATIDTFEIMMSYENDLHLKHLRLFFFQYFQIMFNHEIIPITENTEFITNIKRDCLKDNIIFNDKDGVWSVMYNSNTFDINLLNEDEEEQRVYYLLQQNVDGTVNIYKRVYNK